MDNGWHVVIVVIGCIVVGVCVYAYLVSRDRRRRNEEAYNAGAGYRAWCEGLSNSDRFMLRDSILGIKDAQRGLAEAKRNHHELIRDLKEHYGDWEA